MKQPTVILKSDLFLLAIENLFFIRKSNEQRAARPNVHERAINAGGVDASLSGSHHKHIHRFNL